MTFNKVVFDIETTMTADKIWCIICKHENTYYQFVEGKNLNRFEEFAKQTKEIKEQIQKLQQKIDDLTDGTDK